MKKIIFNIALVWFVFPAMYAQQSQDSIITKYRRSSLYTLMIDDDSRPYANVIRDAFLKGPMPDKFNDHNLTSRIIPNIPGDEDSDKAMQVENYLNSNHVARDLVAKWFNRSQKGGFDMELIKSRGSYDANALDIAKAKASKRGLNQLFDAGEELINNTFVLVNDYFYTDKEETAKKTNGWLTALGTIGDYAGIKNASTYTTAASVGVTVTGKGYGVKTKAYLFRLVWNEEIANAFYNDYWFDTNEVSEVKKRLFENSDLFRLKYVGMDVSKANLQSTIFTQKTNEELIERATIKAVDAVIVKLQATHDEFKTKTPLYSVEPLTAKIGMKEGLTTKSKFDLLEQRVNEAGKTEYVVVGSVKVDSKYPIWDNRYKAEEENPDKTTNKTHFKKVSGKNFYPGMLIVQKKGR